MHSLHCRPQEGRPKTKAINSSFFSTSPFKSYNEPVTKQLLIYTSGISKETVAFIWVPFNVSPVFTLVLSVLLESSNEPCFHQFLAKYVCHLSSNQSAKETVKGGENKESGILSGAGGEQTKRAK